MRCMHTAPDDPALQCNRTATVRFSHGVDLGRVVSGSRVAVVYAYTCEEHQERGPAIAQRRAESMGQHRPEVSLPPPTVERLSP